MTHWNGVILRGERLLIPDAEITPDTGTLRQQVVDTCTAHEGHLGIVKQLLRTKLWFQHLDKMVETRINTCLGCQATTYKPVRDPLKPTPLPDRPWQRVDMDFWGPMPNGEYLLVIIDEYSRYPEVEFVRSTSAQAVIPHLDRVFPTTGFPRWQKRMGVLHLTLFVPGFFVIKYPGGVLIGRTPQKFCKIVVMVLFFLIFD